FGRTHLGFLGLDVLLTCGHSLLQQLERGLVLLAGNTIRGFGQFVFRTRDGIRFHEPPIAIQFDLGVREFRLDSSHLCFAPDLFFRTFAESQSGERNLSLIELTLYGFQAGFEFVGPKLGDDLSLGDTLPFFDGQFHEQPGYRKRKFSLSGCVDLAGENADRRLISGCNDDGFDRSDELRTRRLLPGAPGSETAYERWDDYAQSRTPRYPSPGIPFIRHDPGCPAILDSTRTVLIDFLLGAALGHRAAVCGAADPCLPSHDDLENAHRKANTAITEARPSRSMAGRARIIPPRKTGARPLNISQMSPNRCFRIRTASAIRKIPFGNRQSQMKKHYCLRGR